MEYYARVSTKINYILSSILWLLGILTLLFNALGLWVPWHLVGWGFIFYAPVPGISPVLGTVFSCIAKNVKLIILCFITFIGLCTVILAPSQFKRIELENAKEISRLYNPDDMSRIITGVGLPCKQKTIHDFGVLQSNRNVVNNIWPSRDV